MEKLLVGLAEVFEVDPGSMSADYDLGGDWDSLSIVSTIALIDEVYGVFVEGEELLACNNANEIAALAQKKS